MDDTRRRQEIETWISWVRLGGVAFVVLEIGVFTPSFPPGYLAAAWALTGAFAAGTVLLLWLARSDRPAWLPAIGFAGLLFDTAVVAAYGVVFSYEYGNQTRWALVLVVAEAALRYGLLGGVVLPLVLIADLWFVEWWRARHFSPPGPRFLLDRVTFPAGVLLLMGLIVGWLVRRLDDEARAGTERAAEAERLRDELGRRVDVLEAANRSGRPRREDVGRAEPRRRDRARDIALDEHDRGAVERDEAADLADEGAECVLQLERGAERTRGAIRGLEHVDPASELVA